MKHLGPQHRAAVLALLPGDGPGLDRHQLAARIGISSMSVSRALKRLVEEGKAHVSGYTPNESNGKPRELYIFEGRHLEAFAEMLLSESSGMVTHPPPNYTEGGEI